MNLLKRWVSVLFPEANVCHLCGRGLTEPGPLCKQCLADMEQSRLKNPAFPFLPLSMCVSVWRHEHQPRLAVHQLKYASDPSIAGILAEGMSMALAKQPFLLHSIDALVPVPLHPHREKARGYNQALLLAQEISFHTGLPVAPELLTRIRDTHIQVGTTREERMQNMHNAFCAHHPDHIKGKNLLLTDDVFTTGATLTACAQALLQAGAANVFSITACKAPTASKSK